MLSGNNNLFKIGVFMLFGSLSQSCNTPSCDLSCQELNYNKKIDIGKYNQDAIDFYERLNSINLTSNEVKEFTVNKLFNKSVSKLIFLERMSLDFSEQCEQLNFDQLLKDKEYCQILKVEYSNDEIGYIIGRCEYDIMGFTRSFNKFGFTLSTKAQYLLPSDKIMITYTPDDREKFSIESKDFRVIQ